MRLRLKYIGLTVISILMMISLTGCDGMPASALAGIDTAFKNRLNDNIAIAEDLCSSGLLSVEEEDNLVKSMNETVNMLMQKLTDNPNDNHNILFNAIVDWRRVSIPDPKPDDFDKVDFDAGFLTNSAANISTQINGYRLGSANSTVNPIVVIDEKTAENLNNRMSYPIYILNDNVELDKVVAAINSATAGDTVDTTILSSFFHELKDASGNSISLIDTTNTANKLVQTTYSCSKVEKGTNKVLQTVSFQSESALQNRSSSNKLGLDFVVNQAGEDIMTVRLVEFNQNAYNNIKKQLGLTDQRYLVVPVGSGGRVYLMQYPVGYVSGLTVDTSDGTFQADIKKSSLEVNLKTGKIYKEVTDSKGKVTLVEENNEDAYIKLSGGSKDTSSFIIYGETGVGSITDGNWNLTFGDPASNGGKGTEASIARIVLRDYLEITYSPGTVGTDSLVAYGRKLRLDRFEGAVSDSIAYYVGIDGVRSTEQTSSTTGENTTGTAGSPAGAPTSTSLYLSDFADFIPLCGQSPYKPYYAYVPSISSESVATDDELQKFRDNLDTLTDYDVSKLENLYTIALSSIQPTVTFPGPYIDKAESNSVDSKPLFYGMIVGKSLSQTGLLNWMTSTSTDNSLKWWTTWLTKHKYTYQLNSGSALEFLKSSYKYELNQSGIIILDLDTIAHIQKDYNKEAAEGKTQWMRSIFKVLGYILIGYSAILLGCWTMDTSVDLGMNTLEKASFGKLVAVKDEAEIPISDSSSKSYIGFQNILKSCLVVAIVGIVLIFLDIVQIVVTLVELFSGIAKYIGNLIGGI